MFSFRQLPRTDLLLQFKVYLILKKTPTSPLVQNFSKPSNPHSRKELVGVPAMNIVFIPTKKTIVLHVAQN